MSDLLVHETDIERMSAGYVSSMYDLLVHETDIQRMSVGHASSMSDLPVHAQQYYCKCLSFPFKMII